MSSLDAKKVIMQLTTYKIQFISSLLPVVDEAEAQSFFYLVAEQLHQLRRIDLALDPSFQLTEVQLHQWESIRLRLMKQEPIQYILGSTIFCDLSFAVTPDVLIPRPETEELVSWVLERFPINRQPTTDNGQQLLDIGTGSGCIAVALAKNLPEVHVYALDVSDKALEIAQLNAEKNDVQLHFICQNILETKLFDHQFDVIVSNPPYVRELEKHEIQANVLDHEPHLALFVADEDPLLFYRKIGELAFESLTPNGNLFVEINQYLGEATVQLFQEIGFTQVELRKDLYGNDRMIRASR
jgi:release factor glutamine methyltransferase